ncbi:hypothetical protein COV20_02755 [Candidatus Woesearchaeota archaeon CG10_big_fil_rev_8_21_14_0_10_45_16]|nr:MAG: hypothetical protein COV20_02755 [Candidatus Woesearchaeota archaeon CG10_big_fil_rev_8_21_14_0_10_45_16]
MQTYHEVVEEINPALVLVGSLSSPQSSTPAYKVMGPEGALVLKVFPEIEMPQLRRWANFHRDIEGHHNVLDGNKLPGLAGIIGIYQSSEQCVLLRPYVYGTMIERSALPNLRDDLEKTIGVIHEAGFSGITLSRRNIIVGPAQDDATLVDLDYTYTKGMKSFNAGKVRDKISINRLFSK